MRKEETPNPFLGIYSKNGGKESLGNVSKRMCVCRDLLNISVGFLIFIKQFLTNIWRRSFERTLLDQVSLLPSKGLWIYSFPSELDQNIIGKYRQMFLENILFKSLVYFVFGACRYPFCSRL